MRIHAPHAAAWRCSRQVGQQQPRLSGTHADDLLCVPPTKQDLAARAGMGIDDQPDCQRDLLLLFIGVRIVP